MISDSHSRTRGGIGRVRVFLLLLLICGLPASAQQANGPTGGSHSATVSLRPGDIIRLRAWREPDYSGDFTVDETGRVTLPRLGTIAVLNEPVDALKARILTAYSEYLAQPAEVTMLFRVHVGGEVRTPGLYHVDGTITAESAIALAGGITSEARRDRVKLVRDGVEHDLRLSRNEPLVSAPLHSGDQVVVPRASWISRSPALVIGAVSAVATLMWALRSN